MHLPCNDIIMAIVKSMHMYLTYVYVSMRYTPANTAELSVKFGTNYTYQTVACTALPTLAD